MEKVSSITNLSQPPIDQFFGIESRESTDKSILNTIDNLQAGLSELGVDVIDTIKAIMSEIEPTEDKSEVIKKVFDRFRQHKRMKTNFKDMLSKYGNSIYDLERQAVETGNWTKFLKRSEENKQSLRKKNGKS